MKNNDDVSRFEWLTTLLIGVILGTLVSMYGVFAIIKLVNWFTIPIELTFKQWFGLMAIFGLITYVMVKNKKEDEASPFIVMLVSHLTKAGIITIVLGLYYIIKFFI